MIYAVIDTNVFVSALLSRLPNTATVKLVKILFERGMCPLYNEEIIAEYQYMPNREEVHG